MHEGPQKEPVHEGEVGEDAEKRAEEQLQKLTDEHVALVDALVKAKEAEIMEGEARGRARRARPRRLTPPARPTTWNG